MTDVAVVAAPPAQRPTVPVPVPTVAENMVRAYAQKALVVAALSLGAHGQPLSAGQQADFVSLGVGLALFVLSCAWTYIQETKAGALIDAALNQAPPDPPVAP